MVIGSMEGAALVKNIGGGERLVAASPAAECVSIMSSILA